jgi:branched-chain amino acid transport system ATP-binding protein
MMSAVTPSPQPDASAPNDVLLEVQRLRVDYGSVVAVNEFSFTIARNSVTGLIGPNGAGKTTVVDALTGYTRPTGGHVRLDGREITGMSAHRLARLGLIRTFQSVELFDDLTVAENLQVASSSPGAFSALAHLFRPRSRASQETVQWALSVTDLEPIAGAYPRELSHGQRKLVGVARSLAASPSLLLLDEPAAGLDTDETSALGQRLRRLPEHGVTVLLIDHDMGLVLSVCDHVLVLDFGNQIAAGTPAAIRTDPVVVDAYLGRSSHAHA